MNDGDLLRFSSAAVAVCAPAATRLTRIPALYGLRADLRDCPRSENRRKNELRVTLGPGSRTKSILFRQHFPPSRSPVLRLTRHERKAGLSLMAQRQWLVESTCSRPLCTRFGSITECHQYRSQLAKAAWDGGAKPWVVSQRRGFLCGALRNRRAGRGSGQRSCLVPRRHPLGD